MSARIAQVTRNTKETQITVSVNLDGSGAARFETGIPFLEHMLDQIARHGLIDLSGRPGLEYRVEYPRARVGEFDVDLVREFFQGFVNHALATVHVDSISGQNAHHIVETVFKAFGRALRMALEPDARMAGVVPSTKGSL